MFTNITSLLHHAYLVTAILYKQYVVPFTTQSSKEENIKNRNTCPTTTMWDSIGYYCNSWKHRVEFDNLYVEERCHENFDVGKFSTNKILVKEIIKQKKLNSRSTAKEKENSMKDLNHKVCAFCNNLNTKYNHDN